jgi:uncharacterized membrane protein YeiH
LPDIHPAQIVDYLGVGVFAITGALAAARSNHDIVTFIFFAVVTGIGGGTLRDLLLGVPVFWLTDSGYLLVCLFAAGIVWLIAGPLHRRLKLLLWFDAVGLAAYAALGSNKAIALGYSNMTAIVMGVVSATFGGIIRDVLGAERSVLLRREIYVTAAMVGAISYVALAQWIGVPVIWAASISFGLGFATRAAALWFGWTMPGFRGEIARDDQRPQV